MEQKHVVVLGGGASGLMAALAAQSKGARVTVVEKNHRIGKKLITTGNGRCNYTNRHAQAQDYNCPDFVREVFSRFSPQDTVDFFQQLGIEPKDEAGGKVFPMSEQASSFLDVFLYEFGIRDIHLVLDATVESVERIKDRFRVHILYASSIDADRIIIALGGKAFPLSGSTGDGERIARMLGHESTELYPALVKLKIDSPYLSHLAGVKINTNVALLRDGDVIQVESGDLLFTPYGLSGPTILQLSRQANALLRNGQKSFIQFNLLPSTPEASVRNRLCNNPEKPLNQVLIGLIHKRFIIPIIKEIGIDSPGLLLKDVSEVQREKLMELLYEWKVQISGSLGFSEAQITIGGVRLSDIDPATMASKIMSGAYFAGEVMDIDGPCGGYNLQWAWSSGFVAGINAAR
jgi:predicted Rossmann fold flavoprotein